ncbi:MAG: DUF2281 domain-containing protein [Coleofasciculaceae cyanobacterium SM2_1_6]|nr:DUF2281 domain-containing protein [Coleofasciculaceae cyanobacterium SM2_1_6]
MTVLEKAMSTLQQLPIEKQREALNFIEFLVFQLSDRQFPQESVANVTHKIESSPRDLLKNGRCGRRWSR